MLKMNLLFSIIVILIEIFVAVLSVTSDNSDEFNKILIAHAGICKNETGASDKDITEMMNIVAPRTRVAKCLNECLMNKLGVMKEGKLVPDRLAKLYDSIKTKANNGNILKDVVKDIIEACKTVSDVEKCESAAKILICLNAEAKKRGFDKNVF